MSLTALLIDRPFVGTTCGGLERLADAVHLANNGGDEVAGHDLGFVGGAVLDRRHHQQLVGVQVLADLNADAVEVAGDVVVELLLRLRVDVGRVRIEPVQHALQGDVEVLLVVEVFALAQGQTSLGQKRQELHLAHRLGVLQAVLDLFRHLLFDVVVQLANGPGDHLTLVDVADVVFLDDIGGLQHLAREGQRLGAFQLHALEDASSLFLEVGQLQFAVHQPLVGLAQVALAAS